MICNLDCSINNAYCWQKKDFIDVLQVFMDFTYSRQLILVPFHLSV
jgi:hypothetical protein